MLKLTVAKLPDTTYGFSKTVYHNKNDFGSKTDMIIVLPDGTIYKSTHNDNVVKNNIMMTNLQRNKHNVKIDEKIDITEYKVLDKFSNLADVKINIGLWKSISGILSIHEDELKDIIKKWFMDSLLSFKQVYAIEWNGNVFSCDVISRKTGLFTKDTILAITSSDPKINLISNKLIKRDIFKEDYSFENIGVGGLDKELLEIIRRSLSTRAFSPLVIQKLGVKHVKGMLLYGPPGTGKTLIARKIGSMISNREPKIINGPELLNKYVGQSQDNLREIFKEAQQDYEKKKENADLHIIIFDEFDAMFTVRGSDSSSAGINSSMVAQLLSIIDGVKALNNIFVIGMTNRKDLIDPALLRAGRIEVHVRIGLPDHYGRVQIFNIHTNNMSKNNMIDSKINISKLADLTENFSGAEIEAVVKNASSRALYEILSSDDIKDVNNCDICITMQHLIDAVQEIVPCFGRINKNMAALIPADYKLRTDKETEIFNNISSIINSGNRFNTILLNGSHLSGKTTMSAYIAQQSKVKYTRFLRAIDMISMGEFQKASYITDNIMDAFLSEHSLVIIDDIEIAINYANINRSSIFSNKLYQTLVTILKTPPFEKGNRLTILMTSMDPNVGELLENFVTDNFDLDDDNDLNDNIVLESIKVSA